MINTGELNLALQRGREKVAGWNDLSSSAKSSIAGALGGSALGGLAWLLRPKDKDQNQWKEALMSILSGAALGGAAGYGYDKLPDVGVTKSIKNIAGDARSQAKNLVKQIRAGIRDMYKKPENPTESSVAHEEPQVMTDAEAQAEEDIIRENFEPRPKSGPLGTSEVKHKHPRNQIMANEIKKFPKAYYNDYGFVDLEDTPVIDPGRTKYPTSEMLSWDMVGRFRDWSQRHAFKIALDSLVDAGKISTSDTPIGWKFDSTGNSLLVVTRNSDTGDINANWVPYLQ